MLVYNSKRKDAKTFCNGIARYLAIMYNSSIGERGKSEKPRKYSEIPEFLENSEWIKKMSR